MTYDRTARTPLSTSLTLAAALGLPLLGCTSKEYDMTTTAAEAKTADAKTAPGDDKDGDDGDTPPNADGGKGEGGIADTVRDAIPDPGRPGVATALPERGVTLGWMIARNVEASLGKIKTQVLPPKLQMYGDLATLKGMAGILGEQAKLVNKLNFAEPAGCALLDDKVDDLPLACFFTYEGGAAAVSTDVGQGKKTDAGKHVAHHVIDGQDVFLDDVGGTVIVTTHADLFDKSKAYLTDTLLPYAKTQKDDVSFVAFSDALITRYDAQLGSFMSMAGPSGAGALDMYRDIETFSYGVAIEPDGAHLRMNIGAKAGSDYASLLASVWAGPVDEKWFKKLPSSTWALTAYNAHLSKLRGNKTMAAMAPAYDMAVEGYARETGKDAATVRASIDKLLDETQDLYGAAGAWGVMHEPGTTGAAVLVLEKGDPGREKWKTWTESFAAKDVLDADTLKDLDWSFKADAVTVDGVAADRWTINIKKIADPEVAAIAKRFGGKLELTVDRFEFGDSVAFVAALSDIDKADAAVVAASKGTKTIADAPGGPAILAMSSESMGTLAGDGKRMFAWLSEVAPEGGPYPSVGVDLTDVTMTTTGAGLLYEIDMVMSQGLIDQLKGLVP